jgi:hypothetical protein
MNYLILSISYNGVGTVNVDGTSGSIILCQEIADSPFERSTAPEKAKDDRAYHQARERSEGKAAKEAASVESRRVHQELAQAHARMARCRGH